MVEFEYETQSAKDDETSTNKNNSKNNEDVLNLDEIEFDFSFISDTSNCLSTIFH